MRVIDWKKKGCLKGTRYLMMLKDSEHNQSRVEELNEVKEKEV